MSLFKDERAPVSLITLGPERYATDVADAPEAGSIWFDDGSRSFQSRVGGNPGRTQAGLVVAVPANVTVVTASNPSSAADLMSFTMPAGVLNAVGKTVEFWGAGRYTTAAAQTPTVRIRLLYGATALTSWTSAATTASSSNIPWNVQGFVTVQTKGSAGKMEAHGKLSIVLGTTAGANSTNHNDTNVVTVDSLDLTAATAFKLDVLMSSGDAGNSVAQRQFVIKLIN